MFFLLYFPIPEELPMTDEEIDRMADELTDQLLEQATKYASSDKLPQNVSDRMRRQVRDQVISIMDNMRNRAEEFVDNGDDGDEFSHETVDEPAELIDTKNFLERCFRQSA